MIFHFILLQGGGQGGFGFANILFIASIFFIMYFFMIRPQTKKAKEQQNFMDSLQKGDRVITAGGIHGKIVKIEEHAVLLQVDTDTRIKVDKSVVSGEYTKRLQGGGANKKAPVEAK